MGRIVVTGGAGFIGSHFVERLVAAGEEVVVLDDLSRGRREWLPAGAELHELDVRDASALRQTLADLPPDTVVHLAALHYIPAVEDAPRLASEINVAGTRVLLEALAESRPKLFLFASSAAVYPDQPGPIAESCAPSPIDLYGRTKLEGERLVTEFAEQTGARAIVARIFNVIGSRETNPHVVPEVIGQLRSGGLPLRIGNLNPRRDYTDVRDAAAALERLLGCADDDRSVFNVGSGRSVSVAELIRECEEILRRPIEVRVEQRRLRAQDRAELVADSRLLRQTTGWQPTYSLRETLTELLVEPGGSQPLR
jgi:UDP-glucose 4-epimerase